MRLPKIVIYVCKLKKCYIKMLKLKVLWILVLFIKTGFSHIGDRKLVQINDGEISGVEDVTEDEKMPFWAFLGIPYAAPPLGKYRFQPPQPVKPWNNTLDASKQRSSCMQTYLAVIQPISENCLFINVYTTAFPLESSNLLPVMVYIHGGGFRMGSGNLGLHGADRFLENGVILVSFNYRLGAFGFLCTLDEASPGNYGLKDQIAALRWVKKNIVHFGGDPDRVTIFGQSAGAASIHYLMQSENTKGLYHAAITESGSTLSPWAVAQAPRHLAFTIGNLNLIFTSNSTILVDKLRRIRALRLLGVSGAASSLERSRWNGLPWAPCIEIDENQSVVPGYNYPQLESGKFNRVPLMTGFNSLEARDANILSWLVSIYNQEFVSQPEMLVPHDMNAENLTVVGEEIKNFYFKNESLQNNTIFIKFASDSLFVRGINKHVELMSRYIPVYYYRFAFTGGTFHNHFKPQGASHTEELQFLFNQFFYKQHTTEATLTQQRMIKLWTNFAKYHNPTPSEDMHLLNVKWPNAYAPVQGLVYLNIDKNLTVDKNPENDIVKFWDDLYKKYGRPPYNSF